MVWGSPKSWKIIGKQQVKDPENSDTWKWQSWERAPNLQITSFRPENGDAWKYLKIDIVEKYAHALRMLKIVMPEDSYSEELDFKSWFSGSSKEVMHKICEMRGITLSGSLKAFILGSNSPKRNVHNSENDDAWKLLVLGKHIFMVLKTADGHAWKLLFLVKHIFTILKMVVPEIATPWN